MVFARRAANHSPVETAIELDTDVEAFRENVVNDLDASLRLLSVQRGLKTSNESTEKVLLVFVNRLSTALFFFFTKILSSNKFYLRSFFS